MTQYLADFFQSYYGLNWVYKNTRGDVIEIACNNLSQNFKFGVFEIRASWEKVPNTIYNKYDPIIFKDQSFHDISKWLNKLDERDDKL